MNTTEITREQFFALSVEQADELYLSALNTPNMDNAVILRLQDWEIDLDNPRLTDADKEFIEEWRSEQAFRKMQDEAGQFAAEYFAAYIQPLVDEGMSVQEALLAVIDSYSTKGQN